MDNKKIITASVLLVLLVGTLAYLFLVPADNELVGQAANTATDTQQPSNVSTTTDSDALLMECPGIDFVIEAFQYHMEEYPKFNPSASDEEIRDEWDRLLRSMNCHEFTSDNFGTTFQEFMD